VGNRIARREYAPGAKVRTVLKDLRMAAGLAESLGLELPHLRRALQIGERVVRLGAADEDCAIVYELLAADGRLRAIAADRPDGGPTLERSSDDHHRP
jgi:3-hydroxyisobutyrate dehydrogenase-like beta-hydroxyacid dehydrogenase